MVTREVVQPEQFRFEDDGVFPNSVLPLLVYRQALTADGHDPASLLEERFADNDWCNSWRNGVYSFAHYHSTTHELLGVFSGAATLRLGGEHGKNLEVRAGDVIVIPAGVAHQKRRFCCRRSLPGWTQLGLASWPTGRAAASRSQHRGSANSGQRSHLRRRRSAGTDLEIQS